MIPDCFLSGNDFDFIKSVEFCYGVFIAKVDGIQTTEQTVSTANGEVLKLLCCNFQSDCLLMKVVLLVSILPISFEERVKNEINILK